LVVAVLLAVPALAFAAHRHAPRAAHRSTPSAVEQQSAGSAPATVPTASDALTRRAIRRGDGFDTARFYSPSAATI